MASATTVRLARHLRQQLSIAVRAGTRSCPTWQSKGSIRPNIRSMVVVSQHKVGDSTDLGPAGSAHPQRSSGETNVPITSDAPLIVTDNTWQRIRRLNESKGTNQYLRVFVDAGGCSGFSYVFELNQDEIDLDEDIVLEGPGGEKVVVDQASLDLIRGSTIDYVQEMIKSSFEVRDNPQSESACGCGSSFAVKNFAANPAID